MITLNGRRIEAGTPLRSSPRFASFGHFGHEREIKIFGQYFVSKYCHNIIKLFENQNTIFCVPINLY